MYLQKQKCGLQDPTQKGNKTEPHLQSLSGESISHRSANTEVGARLDVAMYGFWGGRFQKAFLDVRVFNPSAQSNRHGSLAVVYRRHELEKKRQYEQRVRDVERASFTPLVMSTMGGMGKAASTFYKRLTSMLSEKRDISYEKTMNWIRCRLSFALLRASIMSIRWGQDHPDVIQLQRAPLDPSIFSLLKVVFTNNFRYICFFASLFCAVLFLLF